MKLKPMVLAVRLALMEYAEECREMMRKRTRWYWRNDGEYADIGPFWIKMDAYKNHPPVLQLGWYLHKRVPRETKS